MALDIRQANKVWRVTESDGSITWNGVKLAVLMDIRDELRRLNSLLSCANFTGISHTLKQIAQQTKKRKYVRRPKEGQS